MSASSSASSSLNQAGSTQQFGGSGAGDWNVNLAGSGAALQTASSFPWMLVLGAALIGIILWRR